MLLNASMFLNLLKKLWIFLNQIPMRFIHKFKFYFNRILNFFSFDDDDDDETMKIVEKKSMLDNVLSFHLMMMVQLCVHSIFISYLLVPSYYSIIFYFHHQFKASKKVSNREEKKIKVM